MCILRADFPGREWRACRVAAVPRSSCRSRSAAPDQAALRLRLGDLAAPRVRYGYRRLHVLLRRKGRPVNHERVYRLYREDRLALGVKRQRTRVNGLRVLPPPAERPQERWSIDFLTDSLADGRPFRILTIVETVSWASPVIAAGVSLPEERVVAIPDWLKGTVKQPERIAVHDGPEFVSRSLDARA